MQTELFYCFECRRQYDKDKLLPRFLPCGHTFCCDCLTKFLNNELELICPIDKKSHLLKDRNVETFPLNIMLMQALEEKSTTDNQGFCQYHKEPMKSICLTDRCKVCIYCLQLGHHKDHNVKHTKDVLSEGDAKRRLLESLIKDFDKCQTITTNLLEDERKAVLKSIKDRFETLKMLLSMKEQETLSEINFLYGLEEGKASNILGDDLTMKKLALKMVSDLMTDNIDDKFFKAFEADIPIFATTLSYDLLKRRIQEIKRRIDDCLDPFTDSIAVQVQKFQFANYLKDFLNKTEESYFEKEDNFNVFKMRSFLKFSLEDDFLSISTRKYDAAEDVNDLVINLDKLKNIKQVLLDFGKNNLSKYIIASISCIWKHLGQVSSLRINFSEKKTSDVELFNLARHDIWASENIQEFELNLQNCQVTDRSLLKLMNDTLPKMKFITSLNINLSGTSISDKTIQCFATSVLNKLQNLDKFQIHLNDTEIGDQSVEQLFTKMENLRIFVLKIGNTEITDRSLQAFYLFTLPHFKQLEAFQLDLHNTRITNEGFSRLLCNYENVRTYALNLGKTAITDSAVEAFGNNTLVNMKKLENLYLGLSETDVTDQSIVRLFDNMKIVKKFSLSLSSTNVTNKTLEIINKSIANTMWVLETFHLDLEDLKVSELEICQAFVGLASVMTFTINLTTLQANDKNIEELITQTLVKQNKKNVLPPKKGLLTQMKQKLFNNNKS